MNLGFDKRLRHWTLLEKQREERRILTGHYWCDWGERTARGGRIVPSAAGLPRNCACLSLTSRILGQDPLFIPLHRAARAAGAEPGLELLRAATRK